MIAIIQRLCLAALIGTMYMPAIAQQEMKTGKNSVRVVLQKRVLAKGSQNKYDITTATQQWNPAQTAIIICDMWDKHWCNDATKRVDELAPRINEVISVARAEGVLIVHAPSDCMAYYKDYPQRKLAKRYGNFSFNKILNVVNTEKLPSEQNAIWPVDQSDGGCSDTPPSQEHVVWTKENDQISIKDNDVISDSGDEIAAIFTAKGIKNVILMGVHTNMCVIGRSFGLRNMVRLGMNAVLMRDMTDAMYNPKRWPYVTHFEGVNLVIAYIEKYICPTILSTAFTHKAPFGFSGAIK